MWYLKKAVLCHGSITSPVALLCRAVSQTVSPFLYHVKSLCMPNVGFQPNILSLPVIKFCYQIYVASSSFAAFSLWLFFFLMHSFLCLFFFWREDSKVNLKRKKHLKRKRLKYKTTGSTNIKLYHAGSLLKVTLKFSTQITFTEVHQGLTETIYKTKSPHIQKLHSEQ